MLIHLALPAILPLTALAYVISPAQAEPPPPTPSTPAQPATPKPGGTPEARKPLPFEDQILKAAAEYRAYSRVSDQANWAPTDCRSHPPTGAQLSESEDERTHGRKLYFVYAKDAASYSAMSWHGTLGYPGTHDADAAKKPWENPIGQIIVKEAFKPIEVAEKDRPAMEKDTFGQQHLPREYIELHGKLHKTGEAAGLFIMLKLDPKTEGTDNGWVYAVTSPDNKTVINSGRIASCMGCHEQTTRDRLYGNMRSWPRSSDGVAKPPISGKPAKPEMPPDLPRK